MIRAILFDVDGVLLDSFEVNFRFFTDLFAYTGHPPFDKQWFKKNAHLTMEQVIAEHTKENHKRVKEIWEIAAARDKITYHYELLRMPVGAKEIVQKIAKKYKLGVVTSRLKKSVWTTPALKDIELLFETTIAFEDSKNHKPHPEPLLIAASNIKTLPKEIIYVGDMPSDMEAARAAGMRGILFSNFSKFEDELEEITG